MPYSTKFGPQVPYHNQILTGKKTLTADTFAQDELLLPNCPEGVLPAFLKIEMQRKAGEYLDAVGDYFSWSISPKSQDAVLDISDPDCIAGDYIESKGASAVIPEEKSTVYMYEFPAPQLISFKKLYIQLKGKMSTEARYRIHWVPRPSSVPQRDNLVSQLQF